MTTIQVYNYHGASAGCWEAEIIQHSVERLKTNKVGHVLCQVRVLGERFTRGAYVAKECLIQ